MQPFGRNGLVVRMALAALVAASCALPRAFAQPAYSEDEVKAAFLYHFGTYVQWPAPADDDAITIAVLGAPTIVAQLQRFLPNRSIQGRAVAVRALTTLDDLRSDEILFIGAEFNGRLRELIDTVDARPILIVSDARDGLDQGAMVNFQLVDRRVRFEISLPAAQSAGLMLSSRLLSAALRVETVDCRFGCHDYVGPSEVARNTAWKSRQHRPLFCDRAAGRAVIQVPCQAAAVETVSSRSTPT
jgi:hypothetical protein